MSLVAALAITGTVASAQPLADAIQNVDVSGTVLYRYDDRGNDTYNGAATDTNGAAAGDGEGVTNQYKIGVSLSAKVNDDVKFNSRVTANQGFAAAPGNTTTNSDVAVALALTEANFAYTGIANTTVKVGKQGLATPWTNAIDSDGSEQTGTGILAASTMGPVTAAAGYFNQTNVSTDGSNLIVAGIMAKAAMVNLEAWYLDIDDALDSYYFGANASFDVSAVKIGVDAKYTTMDVDGAAANADDFGNYEVGITAAMGIFNAGLAYAESDKNGDGILNSVAKNGQIGYTANLNGTTEADMVMVDLGAQVTPELHVGLNYDVVSDNTTGSKADDHTETFVQVTYQMSKNLMTYVRLADGKDMDTTSGQEIDYNRGRLQVQYSF